MPGDDYDTIVAGLLTYPRPDGLPRLPQWRWLSVVSRKYSSGSVRDSHPVPFSATQTVACAATNIDTKLR
jgi:hypothetical protein